MKYISYIRCMDNKTTVERKMIKAKLKTTGITVYIHEDKKPSMGYNEGFLLVSKQPNSMMTFCADKDDLEIMR